MSTSGSKKSTMEERPGIDSERISSTQDTPFSMSASSGTVIMASTSSAERPSASVWISTYGRENSGTASRGRLRSSERAKNATMPAPARTRSRRRMLQPTSQRIMD
jgi:hypothetical protein